MGPTSIEPYDLALRPPPKRQRTRLLTIALACLTGLSGCHLVTIRTSSSFEGPKSTNAKKASSRSDKRRVAQHEPPKGSSRRTTAQQAYQPPPQPKPMSKQRAREVLAPWKGQVQLGHVSLGMTREEAIAACSLSGWLPIQESRPLPPWEDIPIKPNPRDPVTMPSLQSITCGPMNKELMATFAPPPNEARVISVNQQVLNAAEAKALGTPEAYLARLNEEYGSVEKQVTENVSGERRAEHYAWVFPRSEKQIPCVVTLPASGGKVFTSGIPAGGPCADHLTLRLVSDETRIHDARLELINPELYVATKDAEVRALNERGAGLRKSPFYAAFAGNASRAGLPTREEMAVIGVLEAMSELAARMPASGGGSSGGSGQDAYSGGGGEGYHDAYARKIACERSCDSRLDPMDATNCKLSCN
jgi:hypothetical protein